MTTGSACSDCLFLLFLITTVFELGDVAAFSKRCYICFAPVL